MTSRDANQTRSHRKSATFKDPPGDSTSLGLCTGSGKAHLRHRQGDTQCKLVGRQQQAAGAWCHLLTPPTLVQQQTIPARYWAPKTPYACLGAPADTYLPQQTAKTKTMHSSIAHSACTWHNLLDALHAAVPTQAAHAADPYRESLLRESSYSIPVSESSLEGVTALALCGRRAAQWATAYVRADCSRVHVPLAGAGP